MGELSRAFHSDRIRRVSFHIVAFKFLMRLIASVAEARVDEMLGSGQLGEQNKGHDVGKKQ